MADEGNENILLSMTLDIEDVTTKLDTIKASFDALGQSASTLGGLDTALNAITTAAENAANAFGTVSTSMGVLIARNEEALTSLTSLREGDASLTTSIKTRADAEIALAEAIRSRSAAQRASRGAANSSQIDEAGMTEKLRRVRATMAALEPRMVSDIEQIANERYEAAYDRLRKQKKGPSYIQSKLGDPSSFYADAQDEFSNKPPDTIVGRAWERLERLKNVYFEHLSAQSKQAQAELDLINDKVSGSYRSPSAYSSIFGGVLDSHDDAEKALEERAAKQNKILEQMANNRRTWDERALEADNNNFRREQALTALFEKTLAARAAASIKALDVQERLVAKSNSLFAGQIKDAGGIIPFAQKNDLAPEQVGKIYKETFGDDRYAREIRAQSAAFDLQYRSVQQLTVGLEAYRQALTQSIAQESISNLDSQDKLKRNSSAMFDKQVQSAGGARGFLEANGIREDDYSKPGETGSGSYRISRFQDKGGEFETNTLRGGTYVVKAGPETVASPPPEPGGRATVVGYASPKNPLDVDGGVLEGGYKLAGGGIRGESNVRALQHIAEASREELMDRLQHQFEVDEADLKYAGTLDTHELGKIVQQRQFHEDAKAAGHDVVRYTRAGGEEAILDPSIVSLTPQKPQAPPELQNLFRQARREDAAAERKAMEESSTAINSNYNAYQRLAVGLETYRQGLRGVIATEEASTVQLKENSAAQFDKQVKDAGGARAFLNANGISEQDYGKPGKPEAPDEAKQLFAQAKVEQNLTQARINEMDVMARTINYLDNESRAEEQRARRAELANETLGASEVRLEQERSAAFTKLFDEAHAQNQGPLRDKLTNGDSFIGPLNPYNARSGTAPSTGEPEMTPERYFSELKNSINYNRGPKNFGEAKGFSSEEMSGMLSGLDMMEVRLKAFPAYMTRLGQETVRHGLQLGANLLIFETMSKVAEEIAVSLKRASEFQVQGTLFQNYKQNLNNTLAATPGETRRVDSTNSNDLLASSIKLAAQYGDEVNDVSQDIALWYKRTGDQNAALFLTNETMKFQLATGTQIEDLYKTLTGLSSQAGGIPLDKGDKKGFGLEQTPELLQKITAASIAAGAGLHQVDKNGNEMGKSTNNAAILLLDAMDKDTAALGTLGYSLTDAIAINAALIQSFGNTGQSASEAADKIGRIAGGIASFARPSSTTVKELAKEGINLNGVFNTGGDVLTKLAAVFEKLKKPQQDQLAIGIAGQRQFEALEAILTGVAGKAAILRSMQANLNAEDNLAIGMLGTYEMKMKKLNGEWEGFTIAVGQGALPALGQFINYLATTAIPFIAELTQGLRDMFNDIGQSNKFFDKMNLLNKGGVFNADNRKDIGGIYKNLTDHQKANEEMYSGPVYEKRRLRQKNAKTGKDETVTITDAYVSKAAYYASRPELMRKHPELEGDQALLALENMGNTFNRGIEAGYQKGKINDLFANRKDVRGGEDILSPNGGTPDKPLKDYAAFGDGLTKLIEGYTEVDKALARHDDTLDKSASKMERMARIYGQTKESLKAYTDLLTTKALTDQSDIKVRTGQVNSLERFAAGAKKKADKYGDTEEGKGWLEQWKRAKDAAEQIKGEIQRLQDDMSTSIPDKIFSSHEEYATKTISEIRRIGEEKERIERRRFSTAKSTGMKQAAFNDETQIEGDDSQTGPATGLHGQILQTIYTTLIPGTVAYNTALAEEAARHLAVKEALKDEITAQNESIQAKKREYVAKAGDVQDKAFESLAKISGAPEAEIAYARELLNLDKQRRDVQREYEDQMAVHKGDASSGAIDNWKQTADAAIDAEGAAAKFEERLRSIKDSDWYKGVEQGLRSVAAVISEDLSKSIFGVSNAEASIEADRNKIQSLQDVKTAQDELYSATRYHSLLDEANHKIYLRNMDLEIRKLQEKRKQEEYNNAHPPLAKKIAEDFTKSFLDGYLKKTLDGMLAGITEDPKAAQIKNSLQSYVDTTVNKLEPTMLTFKVGADNLAKAINESVLNPTVTRTDATSGASSGVPGTSTTNMWDGALGNIIPQSGGSSGNLWDGALGNIQGFGPNTGGVNALWKAVGGESNAARLLSSSLAASGHSAIGTGLSAVGNMFTGGAAGKDGASNYFQTAGNVLNAFSQSTDAGVGSVVGGGIGFAVGGPIGMSIGSGIGGMIGGLFGPHYNETKNPDMFADSGYAQGLANANGISGTQANGTTREDSSLKKDLGGKTEIQYLDAFVKAHPNGQGLSADSLQQWQDANTLTAGGTATAVDGLHNGQTHLIDGNGKQISGDQNWKDLLSNIDTATKSIYEFNQSVGGASQALVVFNQYGSGQSFMPYAWNTPGYEFQPEGYTSGGGAGNGVNPVVNNPVNPTGAGSTVPVTLPGTKAVPLAAQRGGTVTTSSTNSIMLDSTINLDGKTIARSTQAYQQRAASQGYAYVS